MTFPITRRALLCAAALSTACALPAAAADKLVIGWQPIVEPSRVPQADGAYEAATGAEIDWKRFEGGADVIAAIASGAIDIGYVGSSPLAAAASRGLPIQTFFVVGLIGESEALVARGIDTPEGLKGKKVATPFVSTAHYSLLTALDHWGIDPKTVDLLNLRPPEIAAAWERGDIDAAYVWDPVLAAIKQSGAVLATSADVAGWGGPTFDAWIVRTDYAEKHPDVVNAFVAVTGAAYSDFRADPAAWDAASPQAEKIARLTGAKQDEVPQLLTGYVFPMLAEQLGPDILGGGTAAAVAATSAFLKAQGKLPDVQPDYAPFVTTRFIEQALASN